MRKSKSKIPQALSEGEETFALHCKARGLTPQREVQFATRGWRFDFAWPDKKVAVEVEGGTSFGRSRHSKGDGFEKDAAKYNRAARDGWIVLRYSTRMVISGEAINEVVSVLEEE
jgi:very-short-patch-repair endonuclease